MPEYKICLIDYDDPMFVPSYASWGAACADLKSAEDLKLEPGSITPVYVGFSVAVDPGWEMQIRARSGMAKRGILVG